jgi:hypothetical protein
MESKLNGDEKQTLELDVSIEEIKNALKNLKPNKSPGEDGIIFEFYITHWEQIKDDFFLLVNDTSLFTDITTFCKSLLVRMY